MRSAQRRIVEDTWRCVGALVDTIGPAEGANDLADVGYASIRT